MNLTNLFNHENSKKGFVTVFNAVLKDVTTGEPLLKLDSLKVSNINVEGQEKEIRGGTGAGLLMTYGYGRTATVEITDALASMDSLQYMFGATEILEGTDVKYNVNELLTVATDAVTLTKTVATGETVYAVSKVDGTRWVIDTDGTILKGIDANDADVTYNPGDLADGVQLDVYYVAEGLTGSQAITLKSSDFPANVTLVGHTFAMDSKSGKKILMELEFPKFKLDPSFNLTLEGEGDASQFSFAGKALENEKNEIFTLKFVGDYDAKSVI